MLILPQETLETKARLLGSLLLFTQTFYKLRTGRDFKLSCPIGRESHFITVCRELTDVFYLNTKRLIINIPPGYGKSELIIHFICWALAHYPDCRFLYISFSHELAANHTYTIKQIIELPAYRKLFGVEIKHDSSAKDNFSTTAGGMVKAFGSDGSITGMDAGLPHLDRFSGGVFMDDMHKPKEVFSATIRQNIISNYHGTIMPRARGINVPFVFIGQRLHQDDLPEHLLGGKDGFEWKKVVLAALDDAGNALYPEVKSKEDLLILRKMSRYEYWSQYQQQPVPAGDSLYKREDFLELPQTPDILITFITGDTAETANTFNDPTVFTFWGLYKIKEAGIDTGLYGIHCLDCRQLWCEPRDLEAEFNDFYVSCLRYPVKVTIAAIEKKSTGTTLLSLLKNRQGLQIIDIARSSKSGSKSSRFIDMQPYIASKRVTFTKGAPHNEMVINHCIQITANDTHSHDDICDTMYDAVKLALIDGVIQHNITDNAAEKAKAAAITRQFDALQAARRGQYGNRY